MKNYTTIIWDFNGTLIDDVYAALGAVNDMLIRRNQPVITLDDYSRNVDIPIWKFYERVFIPGTITPEEAISEFASGYEKYIKPYPVMEGAVKVLEYFRELQKTQLIVSASHIDKVTAQLKNLELYQYFTDVLAMNDYNCTDKIFLAVKYLQDNNISPENVVCIGDCIADWQMSKVIGCDCILNTKGHQVRRELSVTDAVIADSIEEILQLIR